jgi:hypothetical protein
MRILQNVLVVIGSMALGTTLGYSGLVFVIASMQRSGGEPWQAGFGQYLGGLICGAPLGAVAGLAASAGWIHSREEFQRWSALVWLGVFFGLVVGLAASFRSNVHQGLGWWGTTVLTAACGMAGGLIGNIRSGFRD